MGTLQNLTKEQKIILAEVTKSTLLTSNFYFTGGTALSSYYLHHRYSEDLDFFSQKKFDNQEIFSLVETWSKKHTFTFQSRFTEVVYVFNLIFKNSETLKVDFGHYPYKQIEKGVFLESLRIDTLLDIAVNKLLTISQRTDVKDFVDLYFLLQKFTLWDLIPGVKIKFNVKIEPFLLAADFLKAEDFTFLPRMIKPLTLEELKAFYREKAKDLGKQSIS